MPQLNSGDVVRIRSDPEEMKVLNQRIGWKSEMTTVSLFQSINNHLYRDKKRRWKREKANMHILENVKVFVCSVDM